jgi:hypothetical protein
VAVVAVARKLAEEKRARWRYLARQKTGVKLASAARRIAGRSALYGTGIGVQGRKLKDQIAKQAAANAERLYEAIVEQKRAKLQNPDALIAASDLVFDTTRPSETDWERILSQATADIIRKQKRRRPTDNQLVKDHSRKPFVRGSKSRSPHSRFAQSIEIICLSLVDLFMNRRRK